MFCQITGIETPNVNRDEIGIFSHKLVFLNIKGPLVSPSRASRGQTLGSLEAMAKRELQFFTLILSKMPKCVNIWQHFGGPLTSHYMSSDFHGLS